MSMHNIRFDFVCQRHVPLYEHLCNQYLDRTELSISIGTESDPQTSTTRYFIEAFATQAQLEALADDIASDFLLSVWLLNTHIERIEQHSGQRKPLAISAKSSGSPLYFCQHCQPLFGDNQQPSFGNINLHCEHCMGHEILSRDVKSLTQADIVLMANRLISHKSLPLPILGLTLWLTPPSPLTDEQAKTPTQTETRQANQYQRPHILICNPNSLNSHFIVNDSQVLALSSIEKPLICVRASSDHPSLLAPLYEIQFAENRLLVILTEVLRQKGIHWLYVSKNSDQQTSHDGVLKAPLRLAMINHQWLPITSLSNGTMPLPSTITCLHDENNYQDGHFAFRAHTTNTSIDWQVSPAEPPATVLENVITDDSSDVSTSITTSLCALNAALLRCDLTKKIRKAQFVKHAAVLYFSQHNASQIVTLDSQSQPELFFEIPKLPLSGYEICHRLSESPQKSLLDKFKQLFPAEYNQLLDAHSSR